MRGKPRARRFHTSQIFVSLAGAVVVGNGRGWIELKTERGAACRISGGPLIFTPIGNPSVVLQRSTSPTGVCASGLISTFHNAWCANCLCHRSGFTKAHRLDTDSPRLGCIGPWQYGTIYIKRTIF